MSWWLVVWVAWSCPGGWLGQRILPAQAQGLLCAPAAAHSIHPSRDSARRKIVELGAGPGPRLYHCRGLRCSEVRVGWVSVLEIGD